jgi:hypothetical protein
MDDFDSSDEDAAVGFEPFFFVFDHHDARPNTAIISPCRRRRKPSRNSFNSYGSRFLLRLAQAASLCSTLTRGRRR